MHEYGGQTMLARDNLRRMLCAGTMALSFMCQAQCLDWADGFGPDDLGCNGTIAVMLTVEQAGQPILYVGGGFSEIGGIEASSLARWDGATWSEVGGGVGGSVDSLAYYDDGSGPALYVGGQFYDAGGAPIQMLARYAGGAWSEVGAAGLANAVQAMTVHQGQLFIGGRFTEVSGKGSDHLASWDGADWRTFSSGPSTRTGHAMAFDAATGQTVLFGGDETPNGIEQQDTWAYDGGWTLAASDGPDRRLGHTMAYDSLGGRVLLFGGQPRGWGGGTDSRLWAWNGSAWSVVADFMPVARKQVAIAYDQARDRVVWFGGLTASSTYYDDTWEFDGGQWAEVVPVSTRPAARSNYAIAYDAARQQVVMFGGYSPSFGALNDTWLWDGADWVQAANTGPSPRYGHQMVYDSVREMIVMYGGRGDAGWDKDTWGWDGTGWVLLAPFDPSRSDDAHGPMAYDSVRDRVVMRDLLGVTWLWDGVQWSFVPEGGLNGEVFDLASFDGGSGAELYVCGYFTQAGAISASRIARLTDDGWATVGGGVQSDWCYTLHTWDDGGGTDLYVGGSFNTADNQPMRNIGCWDGSTWSRLNVGDASEGGGVTGPVHGMFDYDDGTGSKLYVGGEFDGVDGVGGDIPVGNLAVWDGAEWEPVGTPIDAPGGGGHGVNAVDVSTLGGQTRLFVGGSFYAAGGKPSESLAVWGEPCSPPLIVEQPVDVIAVELEPVQFWVTAWGTRPFSFQWMKDGADLQDDARVGGSATAALTIDPWIEADAGVYQVEITNAHGSVVSAPAGLTTFPGGSSGGIVAVRTVVIPPAPCPWDDTTYLTRAGPGTSSMTGEGVLWAEGAADGIDAFLSWQSNQLDTVVKVDDPAPGTDSGVRFGNYQRNLDGGAYVSEGGEVTFDATVSGDGVTNNNDHGVWRLVGDVIHLVQREGDPAPGYATGVTIDGEYSGSARLTFAAGRGDWLTFKGALEGGGFNPAVDRAIWRWSHATGGEALVQRYTPAPVVGTNILDIQDPARIDLIGNALFWTMLESRTGYKSNPNGWDQALFLGSPGNFQIVAKSGDPAPGFGPEDNFDQVGGGVETLLGDNDDAAFSARVSGPNGFTRRALYHLDQSVLMPLAIEGEPAPGIPDDLPFITSNVHAMNSVGDVAFTAGLNNNGCGGGCPDSGFFFASHGTVSAIAYRFMTPIPGLGDAFEYSATNRVAINDEREMIFQGGVTLYGASLRSVFGWVEGDGMFPIAVPGSQLEIAPGDVRVVVEAWLSFLNVGIDADNLRQAGISDDGRFLFMAAFSDGTQGVFEGSFVDFYRSFFPCIADFNDDGTVNTLDFLGFLNAWVAGVDSADINDDGAVDTLDVLAYLNLWTAGC